MLIYSIAAILGLAYIIGYIVVNRHKSKTTNIDIGIIVFAIALMMLLVDEAVLRFGLT